jgi:hypothetical protein
MNDKPNLTFQPTNHDSNLDPRFEWTNRNNTESAQNIEFIAKINDLCKWKQLVNIETKAIIEDPAYNSWIVTGQTTVDTFAMLHNLSFVVSIRMGQQVVIE